MCKLFKSTLRAWSKNNRPSPFSNVFKAPARWESQRAQSSTQIRQACSSANPYLRSARLAPKALLSAELKKSALIPRCPVTKLFVHGGSGPRTTTCQNSRSCIHRAYIGLEKRKKPRHSRPTDANDAHELIKSHSKQRHHTERQTNHLRSTTQPHKVGTQITPHTTQKQQQVSQSHTAGLMKGFKGPAGQENNISSLLYRVPALLPRSRHRQKAVRFRCEPLAEPAPCFLFGG